MNDLTKKERIHIMVLHWPRLLIIGAWFALGYTTSYRQGQGTLNGSENILDNSLWVSGAYVIATITLIHYIVGGHALRYALSFMVIVYGLARSWAYINQGIYSPASIWVLVIALTLSAYRSSLRGGRDL